MADRSDYEAQTVPDLQGELRSRRLDTDGRKAELVDRLVANDEARAQAESETKDELADELRDRGESVTGTKAELVDRVVEAQAAEGDEEPEMVELRGRREQREIQAGGHTIMVDVDPETPEPIETCSICGAKLGTCVHSQETYGRAWDIAEPVVTPPASETHWPDETVGPRSMVGDDTPNADVVAAEEISEAITEAESEED